MIPGIDTGGGGLSNSSSSATGAIGGDKFTQSFGGITKNETPFYVWLILAAVALVVALMAFKVFA